MWQRKLRNEAARANSDLWCCTIELARRLVLFGVSFCSVCVCLLDFSKSFLMSEASEDKRKASYGGPIDNISIFLILVKTHLQLRHFCFLTGFFNTYVHSSPSWAKLNSTLGMFSYKMNRELKNSCWQFTYDFWQTSVLEKILLILSTWQDLVWSLIKRCTIYRFLNCVSIQGQNLPKVLNYLKSCFSKESLTSDINKHLVCCKSLQ